MLEMSVCDGKVGRKHRGRDLAAVIAMTDESFNQPLALGWLAAVCQSMTRP